MESALEAAVTKAVRVQHKLFEEARPSSNAILPSANSIDVHDLEALNSAAQAIVAREVQLDAKLAVLRERSATAAAAALPLLRDQRSSLASTRAGLDALSRELAAASQAAQASSAGLRAAFESRDRVAQARNMIDELLGLEECAGDVQAAVSRGDYFSAVKRIAPLARALEVDEDSDVPGEIQPSMSLGMGSDRRARQEGERAAEVVNSLRAELVTELDKAAQGTDVGVVCSFVRLIGEMGREDEGHRILLDFCYRQLEAAACEDALRSTSSASAALGRLLQRCAVLLETSDSVFTERSAKATFACAIRGHCLHLGTKLGDSFNRTVGLRSMVDEASRGLQRATTGSSSYDSVLDAQAESFARACEPTLDAMCALLRGVTQWDTYMGERADGVVKFDHSKGLTTNENRLRHAKPFSEMARCTVTVSHFWTLAAVGRAINAPTLNADGMPVLEGDEVAAADGTASGMPEKVDSAFYVLQTSLRRAAHTCDGGISSAAVKHAESLLTRMVLAGLRAHMDRECALAAKLAGAMAGAALAGAQNITQKISAAESSLGTAGSRAAAEAAGLTGRLADASKHLGLLRTLSALYLCTTYAPRLLHQAELDFATSLPPPALASAAAQLGASAVVTTAFSEAFQAGLARFKDMLLPRLHKRVDLFASASYTLQTEAAFAAAEGDSFVAGLVNELDNILQQLHPALVEGARDELFTMLVKSCMDRLESHLASKRYDQLGALQLDRDVRALTKRFAELSSRSVREHVTRVAQMSALLNLESEAEAVELQDAAGWRLGSAEMKQLLALRTDFRSENIEHLHLRA